jgi:hypothetical protein
MKLRNLFASLGRPSLTWLRPVVRYHQARLSKTAGRHLLSMMWLKGCPRCQGDLFEELAVGAELYGTHFVNCLQCGYSLTAEQERQLPRSREEAVASAAMRRPGLAAASGR